MAISWGGYNGHLRVGISASISPSSPSSSTTTVTVTWRYYIGTDGWNFSGDVSQLHESATGWGGTTTTFTNNLSSGSVLVDTVTRTYSVSHSSGSASASANLTGAYNGAAPSHTYSVSLPDVPNGVPTAGEDLTYTAASATGTTAVYTWNPPNDDGGAAVDFYQVQVDSSSAFTAPAYNVSTLIPSARTGTTVTGLSPNTHYYGRVRAHNANGWGAWTYGPYSFAQFDTLSGTPSVPTGLTETASTTSSVSLGWGASAPNGGGTVTYSIDRATNTGFTTGLVTVTQTGTSLTSTGLSAGTTYYYRIKATNSNGASAYSATKTTTTRAVTTYNDSGPLTTLVNNLASAVADKLVHLGTFCWRGKTSSITYTPGAFTVLNMDTQVQACTQPDPPSSGGSGLADFTIQYPGTYQIEFHFMLPTTAGTGYQARIYINGTEYEPTTSNSGKGGVLVPFNNYQYATGPTVSITRRLAVGDTVGWEVFSATGNPSVDTVSAAVDFSCWARVTLVGF